MRCEDAVVEIGPLLSGALSPVAAAALREHLAACATCRAEAEQLQATWQQLADISVPAPDSARMRRRFAVAVDAFQHGIDQARVESFERRPAREALRWTPATIGWLGAMAATLVIGVLLGRESLRGGVASAPGPAASDITTLRQELHDTREMVTLALLRQSSAAERLRGVSWSERIDNPGADVVSALLDTLAHDPNVNVRLAAIDALGRYGDRPGVRSGARDALSTSASSPLVQVALIDLLVQLNDPSSKDSLRRLADDEHTDVSVRDRAKQALQQL